MAEVFVDTDKLAQGLEAGMEQVASRYVREDGHWLLFYDSGHRLRYPVCGIAAVAIRAHAASHGIATQLCMSQSALDYDETFSGHCLAMLMTNPEPLVVDANYSQFLDCVGLTRRYEAVTGKAVFPERKVITFKLSQADVAVNWLTKTAVDFRRKYPIVPDGRFTIGQGHLRGSSEDEIRNVFASIYNVGELQPWEPSDVVSSLGQQIAKSIPPDTIVLQP